jgi:hypothetical protein
MKQPGRVFDETYFLIRDYYSRSERPAERGYERREERPRYDERPRY